MFYFCLQKGITNPVFFDKFFLFLGMSWNNRSTEITVQEDLSFCVCVIHISTVDYSVDIKFQEEKDLLIFKMQIIFLPLIVT